MARFVVSGQVDGIYGRDSTLTGISDVSAEAALAEACTDRQLLGVGNEIAPSRAHYPGVPVKKNPSLWDAFESTAFRPAQDASEVGVSEVKGLQHGLVRFLVHINCSGDKETCQNEGHQNETDLQDFQSSGRKYARRRCTAHVCLCDSLVACR
jgi:hypothetical protein